MVYPPFDNSTPLTFQGYINGTTSITLNSTGYVNGVVEVRGMDYVILLLVAILICLIALVAMAIWDHYRTTWGGRKRL